MDLCGRTKNRTVSSTNVRNDGEYEKRRCKRTNIARRWQNALYINNLYDFDKQCIGWSWYLANDMQFYWLTPPLLVLFY